jgi:hypothetical protein
MLFLDYSTTSSTSPFLIMSIANDDGHSGSSSNNGSSERPAADAWPVFPYSVHSPAASFRPSSSSFIASPPALLPRFRRTTNNNNCVSLRLFDDATTLSSWSSAATDGILLPELLNTPNRSRRPKLSMRPTTEQLPLHFTG